jgi:hypothetical protein
MLKVTRGADTMAGDAILWRMSANYSDGGPAVVGDFVGPAGATDTAIVKYSGTTGKLGQNSGVLIDASNNVTGVGTLNTRTIANWIDGPASATDTAVPRFSGAGGKTVQNSAVLIDASNNISGAGTLNTRTIANWVDGPASAVAGNLPSFSGTTGKLVQDSGLSATILANRLVTTSAEQRFLQNMNLLTSTTALAGVSGTAYFVYLGYTNVALTVNKILLWVITAGAGTQTAELGFFSSPTTPSRANQTLTKIVSTATITSLTTVGLKLNTANFAQAITAGTHLWAGFRQAMTTTQAAVLSCYNDLQQGNILVTTGAAAFSGGTTYAGVIPAISISTNLGPQLWATLD